MLKALLVDDEPYVLEGLSTMVDWAAYGFTVNTATNGEDALEIVKNANPDLVITDIKMPSMNGIEFIRLSLEEYHSTAEFVILSGYNNFSYAKEAMRYHVCDYLLKPTDDVELDRFVSKMAAQIGEKKRKADTDNCKLSFIANQCIKRVIMGEMKESLLKRICTLLDTGNEDHIHCVLIDYEPVDTKKTGKVRELIKKKLGMPFQHHLFEDDMGRFGIMVTEKMPFSISLETFLTGLIGELKEKNGGNPTAALSLPGKGPRSFSAIYKQALCALDYKFFSGDGKVIQYRDVRNVRPNHELCTQDLNALMESVRNGNGEEMEAIVDQLFGSFSQNLRAPESIIAYLKCFDIEMISLIIEMDGNPDGFSHTALALGKAMERLTISELRESFIAHCRYASSYIETIRRGNPHAIVNEMKNYIRHNYRKSIKLKSIAKIFDMNPVYLGQIFTRFTSMPFTQYLNSLRMEEAQKLLRRSDMQIQEVAYAVGFKDAKYFSDKFKSATHVAPSAYKDEV